MPSRSRPVVGTSRRSLSDGMSANAKIAVTPASVNDGAQSGTIPVLLAIQTASMVAQVLYEKLDASIQSW